MLRLLLLLAFGGLAYAAGMRGFLLLLVAFLGSGIMSYFVLSRVRGKAGQQVGGFFGKINSRIDAATRAEDGDDPAAVDVTTAESSDSAPGSDETPADDAASADPDPAADQEPTADSGEGNASPRS